MKHIDYGLTLRRLMGWNDISVGELAKTMGLTPNQISHYRKAKHWQCGTVERVSAAIGCDLVEFQRMSVVED